jgi:formylglycine-generating enzyme required for sulfatase activity
MADPRQTLQDLIRRFGTSLAEDPQRCKGMLRDLCGSSKREIAGLVAAIEEKVTLELMKRHPIPMSLRANMVLRLENHRGLAKELAIWTVDTWGLVLGTWTQADLDTYPSLLSGAPPRMPQPAQAPVRPAENVIDLSGVVVEPPNLDWTQDLGLTATERQRGVKKTIFLDGGTRLEVTIPAGIQVGQKLRVRGHGAVDPVTGRAGDVYLVIQNQVTPPAPVPTPQVSTPSSPSPAPQVPTSSPVSSGVNLADEVVTLPNNGGTLELIAVPGGTLVMEGGHRVNLKPFLIGKYPITQRQYQAVMGQNPSHFKGNLDCPVECVTWDDAIAFCQKLSQILKQTIDLPSETQWEWAARGATKSKGFEYAGSNNLEVVGWYWENSGDKRLSGDWDYDKITKNNCRTHLVGQKKPNELGLYDISGNVWEWCKDKWTYNSNVLPLDGTPLNQGGDSSLRAVRGGSWNDDTDYCRCVQRVRNFPGNRDNDQGFRVILFPSTPSPHGLASSTSQVLTPQVPIGSPVPVSSAVNLTNKVFHLPNNGGKLELIAVPGGTLVMEGGHRVNLKPFLMGKYPITQWQYQVVMGQNPSYFEGNLDCPVECITWQDAIAFCEKLSKVLKQNIDLPSETQWEWAARGATKSNGFEYAGSNNLEGVGWYDKNSGNTTHPVGQKKSNELGLYDMSGNVWEWCKDKWTKNANVLPQDGTALTQGGNLDGRAVRGGSWVSPPWVCRSAYRFNNSRDLRGNTYGFRVACPAPRTL